MGWLLDPWSPGWAPVPLPGAGHLVGAVGLIGRLLTGALHGDVGIVVVDDGLGVERPRPVVVGGALVVMAAGSSSM